MCWDVSSGVHHFMFVSGGNMIRRIQRLRVLTVVGQGMAPGTIAANTGSLAGL